MKQAAVDCRLNKEQNENNLECYVVSIGKKEYIRHPNWMQDKRDETIKGAATVKKSIKPKVMNVETKDGSKTMRVA